MAIITLKIFNVAVFVLYWIQRVWKYKAGEACDVVANLANIGNELEYGRNRTGWDFRRTITSRKGKSNAPFFSKPCREATQQKYQAASFVSDGGEKFVWWIKTNKVTMTQHVIPQHLPRRIRAKQLRERSPSLSVAYEACPAARWCNAQDPTDEWVTVDTGLRTIKPYFGITTVLHRLHLEGREGGKIRRWQSSRILSRVIS